MNDEFSLNQDELEEQEPAPERRLKPPTWPHWRRAFKWLAITCFLGVIAIGIFLFINVSKISVNPFSFGKLNGESRGRINIMMLGVGDPGHDGEKLSDTDILLSVDTVNKKIAVLSIPRDTQVAIPGYGYGKINTANSVGGIATAEKTFEKNFGQPVDYYVKANFTGLKDVVDAVGGIDVNNTTLLSDPTYPCDNNQYRSCGYKLAVGHYHLDGTQALKYVRCRKGTCGDDFGRAARQQEVMQQIRSKVTSAGTVTNPIALGKLVSAAGNNIETDLSVNNMARLNQITKQIAKDNIYNAVLSTSPNGFLVQSTYSSDLLPVGGSFVKVQDFVKNIFTRAPIWIEAPVVVVENGTTTVGLGGTFKTKLVAAQPDITVAAVINAATSTNVTSRIIDYSGGKSPNTLAYLKKMLGVQPTLATAADGTSTADVVVIVGADYAAKVAPQPAAGTGTSTTGTSTSP